MTLTKKIRKLNRFLPVLKPGSIVVCGIKQLAENKQRLKELGFSDALVEGQSILPSPEFGPVCQKNAEGWIEKHKDRPKETYYTPIMWQWKEWRGRYDFIEREETRYRSGERYPITEHPPLGIELVIRLCTDASKIVTLEFLEVKPENYERIVDSINMLIEIFGRCDLLTGNLDSIIKGEVKRLNWRILPPGKLPWETLKEHVKEVVSKQKEGNQKVILDRFETINHFDPEMVGIGEHGFSGYFVFGFPNKQMFLLESIFFGNATYVLGKDWKELSKLSKGELISKDLYEERVVHVEGWHERIRELLE